MLLCSEQLAYTAPNFSWIRFLILLLAHFKGCIPERSVRMEFDQVPEQEEVLSRFIFSSSHFTRERVKPGAFLPTKELETSMFRGAGLDGGEILKAGDAVGLRTSRALKAWGDVRAGEVFTVGLAVRPDNVPLRHAAIIGWPGQKDERLSLAQRLAVVATLRLPL